MQIWEYKRVQVTRNDDQEVIEMIDNEPLDLKRSSWSGKFSGGKEFWPFILELGEQGWELVTVHYGTFYFKRPMQS